MDSARTEITPALIVGPPPEDLADWQRLPEQWVPAPVLATTRGALLATLKAAKGLGCSHAMAFTTDRTCDADDFTLLLDSARENPSAVALGYRSPAPPTGLLARLSDLFIRLETGLRLRDTRGPRIYPLQLIDAIATPGTMKLTHMEILVRAAWVGCPIIEILLPSRVVPAAQSPAHPKQVNSARKELLTHFRLLARALSGWPHPKYDAVMLRPPRDSFWRNFLQWFNPLRAWRELRQGGATRSEIAAGVAAGVFIANTPAWGFHTVLSLYVAKRLHLHPLAVVAGSHVSAPPMGPFLVASAMWLGHVLLHHTRPTWKDVTPFQGDFFAHAIPLLADWMLGAAIIGTTLAITVFIVANFLFRFLERREFQSEI